MGFVFALFVLSFAGIVGLVALKEWEMRHGRLIAPKFHESADAWALHFRELFIALEADVEKLPPEAVHFSRIAIHKVALVAAASLRFLEQKTHQLADLVSHKHRFERRAPRSEFLNKVMEYKNGGDSENGESGTTRV